MIAPPDASRLLAALEGSTKVRDWALLVRTGRRLALGIKDREAGSPHSPLRISETCSGGYRLVWQDGRVSRGHLERAQLDDPAGALDLAFAAAYDDPDAAEVAEPAPLPQVELHDAATAEAAAGSTASIQSRLEAVTERMKTPDVTTWSGSFSASESAARLLTSRGFDGETRSTGSGWSVTINGKISDGFSARRPESDVEFTSRLERLLALSRELEQDAAPPSGGEYPVLLDPGVVQQYVLGTLLHNLAGRVVAHGEGQFDRSQFGSGEAVIREDVTLRFDPTEPYKSGSYRFSGEGVPAAPFTYVDRGRLVSPVLDRKYARRLGLTPTPPPGGADTLFFEGSTSVSLDDGLRGAAGGVLVLSVLGVHTQDSSSGDFSLSAPQSLAVSADGRPAGHTRCTLSGNLFEILRSPDLQFVRFEGENIPGLLFRCRLDPAG